VTTAITHITLADSEGDLFIGIAKVRAADLYARLERAKQLIGSHRFEYPHRDKTFYIEIRVQMPHVHIYIDSKTCPTFLSGLVWIKSFFTPTVTVDDVEYLRTMFKKDAPTVEENVSKLAASAGQLKTMRSGQFSGEMRKVVQILQGTGREVPYSPTSGTTHGVFRTTGGPWVIKISSDGVVAYPMKTCRGKNSPTSLGYTPLPTAEPEEPRVLMTAEAIKDAYTGKRAFYGLCGWAFSSDGSKAANCFVGSKDMYSYAWQYQISITADDDGQPISASMARLTEGYIHGPKTSHMKYPRSDIPTALYSFDPYRGNANYRNDCSAPAFCYYDGGQLQTFFYNYAPGESFSRTDAGDGRSGLCTEFDGVQRFFGSYSENAQPVIRLNSRRGSRSVRDRRSRQTIYTSGPLGMGNELPDFPSSSVVEVWFWNRERETARDNVTGLETSVLIVTGYEREAAYIAEVLASDSGGFSASLDQHAFPKSLYTKEPVEPCYATSDLSHISFTVGAFEGSPYNDDSCQSGKRYGELFGYWVFPGTGVGSLITWREQVEDGWNGCRNLVQQNATFYAANGSDVATWEYDIPRTRSTDYKLSLYASDAGRVAVNASNAEVDDWIDFIEQGMNDQLAQVVRDAFAPSRMAFSRAPNKARGYELQTSSQFGPYSLDAVTSTTILFVGEP